MTNDTDFPTKTQKTGTGRKRHNHTHSRHPSRSPRQMINGWLILDKPSGITSTAALNQVKHLLHIAKAGHGGTLDPLATGLLPLAFGEATKTVPYVMEGLKRYRFTLRFGEARDTDDADGMVIAKHDYRPSDSEICAALPHFTGTILQSPPRYSAVKIDGKRAYALAREGAMLELAARPVDIQEFTLISRPDPDHAVFEVTSGKGAYMRSLARDLARHCGSLGHIMQLRRLAVGPFEEADAISLESLEKLGHSAPASEEGAGAGNHLPWKRHLLAVETALADIPAFALTPEEAARLRHGQAIECLQRPQHDRIAHLGDGDVQRATLEGKTIGLIQYQAGRLSPLRIFSSNSQERRPSDVGNQSA